MEKTEKKKSSVVT